MNKWWKRSKRLLPGGDRLSMPPRAVTRWFWGIMLLLSLPFIIMGTAGVYDTAVAQGLTFGDAALRALGAFTALSLAYGFLAGVLFFGIAFITSVVIPDVVSAYRAADGAVRRAPAAWQRFRDNAARAHSRVRQRTVAILRYLGQVPVRIAAMRGEDWLFALFFALSLLTLAGMLYLGWGWAGAVVAWLPAWLVDDRPWFFQLLVDFFMCMIPFSIAISLLSSLVKVVVRRIRRR